MEEKREESREREEVVRRYRSWMGGVKRAVRREAGRRDGEIGCEKRDTFLQKKDRRYRKGVDGRKGGQTEN